MFVGNRFLRMNSHSFDHVDLRVSSFAEARKLYDVFLPALGFPGIRARKSRFATTRRATAKWCRSSR
jgi:hypothetical protein